MTSRHPDFDHFVHALSSPLTALHGATGLLRRRGYLSTDPMVHELLATLERSILRLQAVSKLLIAHAVPQDEELMIHLPAGSFHDRGGEVMEGKPSSTPVMRLPPNHTLLTGYTGQRQAGGALSAPSGMVLLISSDDAYVADLGQALREEGYTPLQARSALEGIDQTRQLRPDLIMLDLQFHGQGVFLAQVLSEDPDTKTIPLLMLGRREEADDLPLLPPNRLLDRDEPQAVVLMIVAEMLAMGREHGTRPSQILIVDDEVDIRRLVALQLEGEGYRTTTVGSGTEALYVAQQHPFDLIILDLMLPDLDGFTVLGGLRAQPRSTLTPIILLSALDAPSEKVRGLQLGADDYVTKPFSGAELSARVQAAIRRSELEGSANPSTRLPGNVTIERAIWQRIDQETPFAVCYSDLDNFKAFNDTYSFLKGDAIIQQTARVLTSAVRDYGNPDDFVGHIGGDDFVIITTPDRVAAICQAAIARFDEVAPLFYDTEVRKRGYIESIDRQGNPAQFPLVSISIGVVTNRKRPFRHPGEVAQRSVEPKKYAKRQVGSVYVIDE